MLSFVFSWKKNGVSFRHRKVSNGSISDVDRIYAVDMMPFIDKPVAHFSATTLLSQCRRGPLHHGRLPNQCDIFSHVSYIHVLVGKYYRLTEHLNPLQAPPPSSWLGTGTRFCWTAVQEAELTAGTDSSAGVLPTWGGGTLQYDSFSYKLHELTDHVWSRTSHNNRIIMVVRGPISSSTRCTCCRVLQKWR